MISDEEIKRIAEECGLLPEGELPAMPVEKFVDYQDLHEALLDFARAIYNLGRQHQRDSDAALCDEYASVEGIAQKCATAIRNNTVELE